MKNLVSVIIPTYNSEKFITETIQSVWAQTYPHYEIIIIDDGSKDDTVSVVKTLKKKITFIEQENKGSAVARNVGMKKAKGEFIAFLDADDIWLPTKLQEQVDYFKSHPEVGVVFSYAQNTTDLNKTSHFPIVAAHVPATCMFRKEILKKVGLLDEDIKFFEFVDWYSKILLMGIKVGCVKSHLLMRRIHGGNIGIVRKKDQIEYVRLLKKKLDRERLLKS